MAEIQIFPSRISTEGAQRLLAGLQQDIASGRDLGPRGTQMRSLGHSLEQASEVLRSEVKRIMIGRSAYHPTPEASGAEVMRLRDELMRLADALARLAAMASAYPA